MEDICVYYTFILYIAVYVEWKNLNLIHKALGIPCLDRNIVNTAVFSCFNKLKSGICDTIA